MTTATGTGERAFGHAVQPIGMDVRTCELTTDDASALAVLYDEFEWWAGRGESAVREALAGTDVALGVRADDDLVAAARVLTDFTFYGTVYDVIVAADRRGEGFGHALMEAVVGHDELAALDVLDLRCREGLVPFYERVGFEVHDPTLEVGGREESFVKMNYQE